MESIFIEACGAAETQTVTFASGGKPALCVYIAMNYCATKPQRWGQQGFVDVGVRDNTSMSFQLNLVSRQASRAYLVVAY